MTKKLLTLFGVMGAFLSHAQNDTIHKVTMDEFVISANKFAENKKNIAQQIQRINQQEIEWAMPQTTAGLLEQAGNVFVQRSQAGGGSPVLRGFEANRILMVVDGVRMNNAIYRGGHLQNVITIDNNMLESTEVLFGPASTLYGSDALGGVIVFNTKQPKLSLSKRKPFISANAMTRYSSANNEKTGHVDFNIGSKKVASLTSITYSDFGDLRQGAFRNPFYGDFGLRDQYVERINGVDSVVTNPDNNVQKYTGYTQFDLLQKILFKPSRRFSHGLNLQYSTSSNIPRTDRLTDMRDGSLRYAQWYYGPQDRLMAAYQFNANDLLGFFEEISAGVNYQAIEESRYQRDYRKTGLQSRIENVDIIGYNVDAKRFMNRNELTVGLDGQYNKVRSTAHTKDIISNLQKPLDTRYPNGGSNMFYTALYAQHIFKIIEDKLILNDGVRLNYVDLNARFSDTTFFQFPYTQANQRNIAGSGNLGFVYMPLERWRFVLNGSSGFRAPNVDDLAKVFESAAGKSLVVPNPELRPEYTYNIDLGITYAVDKILKVEATGFHTWMTDAIVQDKFKFKGQDSLEYNGVMTAVVANQNAARAYVYGFNAGFTANLTPNVTLYSTVNFVYGRYINAQEKEVPLDHVPPVFGKTSIMYSQSRFTGEIFALYNGWKRLQDYSPSGEDNLVYATANGMPSWYTLNTRVGYKVNKYLGVQVALENILDYNYRVFASGVSAPGRNLVVTLRGSF